MLQSDLIGVCPCGGMRKMEFTALEDLYGTVKAEDSIKPASGRYGHMTFNVRIQRTAESTAFL